MQRFLLAVTCSLALQSCGVGGRQTNGQRDHRVTLQGNRYFFPGLHTDAFLKPSQTGSHQYYIRLIPPGGYYWLVYDPWRERSANTLGPDVPTISHVSDWNLKVIPKARQVKLIRNEAGVVVCRTHPVNDESAYLREDFTCGFRVIDDGVPWSVIIPGDLAASAPALKRRAQLTLAAYRRDERARR